MIREVGGNGPIPTCSVMPKLPDHFVLSIKDQLRSARYRVRRCAHRLEGRERSPFEIPRPIAEVADAIFSQAEATAFMFLSETDEAAKGQVFPLPVSAYFAHLDDNAMGEGLFTRVFYAFFTEMLRNFGARGFLVFEEAIEDGHSALLLRHRELIWSAIKPAETRQCGEAVAQLCSAIVCAISAQRPIKELDIDPGARSIPRHLLAAPNAYCALVAGLATAIVSLSTDVDDLDKESIVEAADLAIDARFAQFKAALQGRDPVTALTRQFLDVLPFLP